MGAWKIGKFVVRLKLPQGVSVTNKSTPVSGSLPSRKLRGNVFTGGVYSVLDYSYDNTVPAEAGIIKLVFYGMDSHQVV